MFRNLQVDGLWAEAPIAADFAAVVHRQMLLGALPGIPAPVSICGPDALWRPATKSADCTQGSQPHDIIPLVALAQVSMRYACRSVLRTSMGCLHANSTGKRSGLRTGRSRQACCPRVRLGLAGYCKGALS